MYQVIIGSLSIATITEPDNLRDLMSDGGQWIVDYNDVNGNSILKELSSLQDCKNLIYQKIQGFEHLVKFVKQ
jgi:hypothetical protein